MISGPYRAARTLRKHTGELLETHLDNNKASIIVQAQQCFQESPSSCLGMNVKFQGRACSGGKEFLLYAL
jgi:hypothetical protein